MTKVAKAGLKFRVWFMTFWILVGISAIAFTVLGVVFAKDFHFILLGITTEVIWAIMHFEYYGFHRFKDSSYIVSGLLTLAALAALFGVASGFTSPLTH